ncbi:MAG: diaminopimelate decarboxylase [Deltaproteobacteria bacterium]|nr:diaminopimelate decarboxylase [Deltaproteobacteria bacterium]
MHYFEYKDNELCCEEVPVRKIAESVGTPFYLYSYRTLARHFSVFDKAFGEFPHIVCFSVKANSNLAVLSLFASMGGGADIVSCGELFRALKAGMDPKKIVFSGVGKTEEEIQWALKEGILIFNIESEEELRKIDSVAGRMKTKAAVALRVNPDVDPKTHPYIATGLKKSKFGIAFEKAYQQYQEARSLQHIEILGVDCHIGSQLTEVSPFVDALKKLKELVLRLRKEGIDIRYLDLGGGLGITYDEEKPPDPAEYAQALIEEMKDLHCTLILEPGRVIVGNAGVLVTRVLYNKDGDGRHFVIVDAGMNDLIRPSLYGAFQEIVPVRCKEKEKKVVTDVVGPICESGDFLAKDRALPELKAGELLAVMSAGAYGFAMSSNYNSRRRVAEVLVRDDRFEVVRARETYEDLIRGESIPEWIKT